MEKGMTIEKQNETEGNFTDGPLIEKCTEVEPLFQLVRVIITRSNREAWRSRVRTKFSPSRRVVVFYLER